MGIERRAAQRYARTGVGRSQRCRGYLRVSNLRAVQRQRWRRFVRDWDQLVKEAQITSGSSVVFWAPVGPWMLEYVIDEEEFGVHADGSREAWVGLDDGVLVGCGEDISLSALSNDSVQYLWDLVPDSGAGGFIVSADAVDFRLHTLLRDALLWLWARRLTARPTHEDVGRFALLANGRYGEGVSAMEQNESTQRRVSRATETTTSLAKVGMLSVIGVTCVMAWGCESEPQWEAQLRSLSAEMADTDTDTDMSDFEVLGMIGTCGCPTCIYFQESSAGIWVKLGRNVVQGAQLTDGDVILLDVSSAKGTITYVIDEEEFGSPDEDGAREAWVGLSEGSVVPPLGGPTAAPQNRKPPTMQELWSTVPDDGVYSVIVDRDGSPKQSFGSLPMTTRCYPDFVFESVVEEDWEAM